MQIEDIAGILLLLVLLAMSFAAGYWWRVYVMYRRHNQPWRRKPDKEHGRGSSRRR